jgi:hypothetical protein
MDKDNRAQVFELGTREDSRERARYGPLVTIVGTLVQQIAGAHR